MAYRLTAAVLVGILALLISPLWAKDDALRCGDDLIGLGETMYEVREACGPPAVTKEVGEKITYNTTQYKRGRVESRMYITEWVYERNDGIYVLTFEGSRLVEKEFIFQ